MEKEIFKKVEDSIQKRTELKICYLTNIGIQSENLIFYLEPP